MSKRETPCITLASASGSKPSGLDQELVCFGERILSLLKSRKIRDNDYALAALDDLLGAVHMLILAFHNKPPFKYRPHGRKIDLRPLLKRARGIAQAHQIRTTGKWMAGCHFNSAMFRLSSVYHRSLRIATNQLKGQKHIGDEKDAKSLIHSAKKAYKGWTHGAWDNGKIAKVHNEVNQLKHSATGIYWGRDVREIEAITATNELLTFLEAWSSHA